MPSNQGESGAHSGRKILPLRGVCDDFQPSRYVDALKSVFEKLSGPSHSSILLSQQFHPDESELELQTIMAPQTPAVVMDK
jgi:hypothetical protein